MKRKLLILSLLASTAMTAPTQAKATPPVLGFIQGIAASIAGSAVLGGTVASAGFLTGVSAGALGAGFFGTLGGRILLSLGLSYLSQALMPRPSVPEPSATLANFAQPVSYAETVYGRCRKGGPLGFTGFNAVADVVTGAAGAKRHYSPILAAHSCHQIVTHFLDEREVELDANGTVITPPMANWYRIRPFLGQPGQTADATLVNSFAEVTSAFDFAGLAGAHIWAARPPQDQFSAIYPTGRQGAYTPVIDGKDTIYDPRSDATGFTRNAGLILADWILGMGQSVDWDEVAAEADASDVVVTNGDGGTQPKWRLDGKLSDDQEFEDQRAQLAAGCDAWMYERADGKVGFRVGRYIEPTVTLTQEDFLSVEFTEGGWGRDAPTEVAAKYIEPNNNWREAPSAPYVIESGERQVREEPSLYMVSSHNQASRLNKRIAKVKRPKYQFRGTLGLMGYFLRGHRFVRVQALGIDAVFEVGELWRNEGGISFDIVANSVEADDFEFVAALEEPDRPVFAKVENDDTITVPTGLAGSAQDGGSILWSWDDQDPSLTQQLRIRKSGESDWLIIDVPAEQAYQLTSGLVDGETYEAQTRNRTPALRSSDWAPGAPIAVQAVANSTPPVAHADFTATLNGSDVELVFTAPNDPNYYATRIYRALDSTYFADAALIHTEYGIPSNADGYTDPTPAAGNQSYWVVPINQSGKPDEDGTLPGTGTGPEIVAVP
ncbi:hypothetical protein [Pseudooceanicola nitratireducens]|uniref:hypothetical protein n=1 Tax=Pseudooceanicola nitratireducens TaxID=517719 RepID=UPI0023F01AD3|nr:hypothetical protein [Pseudooceanicola nitratireducens]